MDRRVNVRGIIVNEKGQLFAVKHRTHEGHESDYWATPGGGLDTGEPLLDGLSREMVEETGVKPKIGKLLFMQQYVGERRTGEKIEGMELFFHIENTADYEGDIDLSAASHGFELTRVDFIDPVKNDVLPSFLRTIDIKNCIENDLPVHIVNNFNEEAR